MKARQARKCLKNISNGWSYRGNTSARAYAWQQRYVILPMSATRFIAAARAAAKAMAEMGYALAVVAGRVRNDVSNVIEKTKGVSDV